MNSGKSIAEIDRIALQDVVPEVFSADDVKDSQVWHGSCVFERGRSYCVSAASGRGKTSMCAFVYGLRRDYRGTILFSGKDIRGYSVDQWCETRCRHLSYLSQELDVFPELTAKENVMLKNGLTGHKTVAEIDRMFERLGIEQCKDRPAGRMSVGQRQRLALIRALCQPFDFILLDEPVSHLDAENNKICAGMIEEEASGQGAGIISTSVGNPLLLSSAIVLNL